MGGQRRTRRQCKTRKDNKQSSLLNMKKSSSIRKLIKDGIQGRGGRVCLNTRHRDEAMTGYCRSLEKRGCCLGLWKWLLIKMGRGESSRELHRPKSPQFDPLIPGRDDDALDHPLMGTKRGESVPEMLELKSPSFHPTTSAILQLKAMFIPKCSDKLLNSPNSLPTELFSFLRLWQAQTPSFSSTVLSA